MENILEQAKDKLTIWVTSDGRLQSGEISYGDMTDAVKVVHIYSIAYGVLCDVVKAPMGRNLGKVLL
jgi:hypothetical protein